MNVQAITMIGDASHFDGVSAITHDGEFVQVRLRQLIGPDRVYVRKIRQRGGPAQAWTYSAAMARTVEEAAAMFSTPALIAWLIDSGFSVQL